MTDFSHISVYEWSDKRQMSRYNNYLRETHHLCGICSAATVIPDSFLRLRCSVRPYSSTASFFFFFLNFHQVFIQPYQSLMTLEEATPDPDILKPLEAALRLYVSAI